MKKPLTLPFLDYGSVERRHEMCREEVRLNRPFAPRIYLGSKLWSGPCVFPRPSCGLITSLGIPLEGA